MDEQICKFLNPEDCKKCITYAECLSKIDDLTEEERQFLDDFFAHVKAGKPITVNQKETLSHLAYEYLK